MKGKMPKPSGNTPTVALLREVTGGGVEEVLLQAEEACVMGAEDAEVRWKMRRRQVKPCAEAKKE